MSPSEAVALFSSSSAEFGEGKMIVMMIIMVMIMIMIMTMIFKQCSSSEEAGEGKITER